MRKALLVVILAGASAFASTVSGSLSFSNTPLLRSEGESEPAVAVANDGTVAVTGLQWLFNPSFFGTHFWTGPFGSTPTFQGLLDSGLRQPGKIDRKSTRLNSSHVAISYAVFCLKKKKKNI